MSPDATSRLALAIFAGSLLFCNPKAHAISQPIIPDGIDRVVANPHTGILELVQGRMTAPAAPRRDLRAIALISQQARLFHLQNPQSELRLLREQTDRHGQAHLRFDQYYLGLPVWGCQTIVHFRPDTSVYLIAGQLIPTPTVSTRPAIAPRQAETLALDTLHSEIGSAEVKSSSQLLIFPVGREARLAWRVSVSSPEYRPINWQVFVDAQSGTILERYNDICNDGPTISTGVDLLGETRALQTYQTAGKLQMIDASHPMFVPPVSDLHGVIATYSSLDRGGSIVSDPNLDGQFIDNPALKAAVSAHNFAQRSWEYFYNTFGYSGWHDSELTITVNVHDSMYYNNAYFWPRDTQPLIAFSDGDATVYREFCADPDVVGHEFTHGVTVYSANLIYRFESGALNESISDFFGNMIDRTNWLGGDKVLLVPPYCIRNMQDPHVGYPNNRYSFGAQPAHLSEFVEIPIGYDNGGVHINSGIPNHVGYLVASDIGREKAEQIWFHTLIDYLTPNSTFEFWANVLTIAAADLYGRPSVELSSVIAALDSVGFGRVLSIPDKIADGFIPMSNVWDTALVIVTRGAEPVTITAASAVRGKFLVTGTTPTTLALGDSAILTISLNPAAPLELCDVGYINDTIVLTTSSPITPEVRIPIRSLFGYADLGDDSTTLATQCLHLGMTQDVGVYGLFRDPAAGEDSMMGLASLLVGAVVAPDTLMYGSFHDFANQYFVPNIMPLDSFSRSVTPQGDSLMSLPFASYDGKLHGRLRYQWEPQSAGGCGYVAVDYWLTNPCDEPVVVLSGMLHAASAVNDTFWVDPLTRLSCAVQLPAASSVETTVVAIAKLGDPPRNSRLISRHGPGQLPMFNNGWVYREMLETVDGARPGSAGYFRNLITFDMDTLGSGKTVHHRGAFLYSKSGLAGLRSTFYRIHNAPDCCEGTTGNVNLTGIVDVSDLSVLVSYLTALPAPTLPCLAEANINALSIVDLSDLSVLVAYLTANPPPILPNCP